MKKHSESKQDSSTRRLDPADAKRLREALSPRWRLPVGRKLKRIYEFKDFAAALAFTNRIGAVAEKMEHHPDLLVSYGRVVVEIYTHKVNSLTEDDFELAKRIDALS